MNIARAAMLLLMGAAACSSEPPRWTEVGNLDSGAIRFIEVADGYAHDAATYREAAIEACNSSCIQIGFFPRGAVVPGVSSRREFFEAGGWANYDPVAVYMGGTDQFTRWDCERITAEGAPEGSLCSGSDDEVSLALYKLAIRAAYVEACDMKPTKDRQLVDRFAATQPNGSAITQEFIEKYHSGLSGPDDVSMCPSVAEAVERNAVEARALLESRMASAAS